MSSIPISLSIHCVRATQHLLFPYHNPRNVEADGFGSMDGRAKRGKSGANDDERDGQPFANDDKAKLFYWIVDGPRTACSLSTLLDGQKGIRTRRIGYIWLHSLCDPPTDRPAHSILLSIGPQFLLQSFIHSVSLVIAGLCICICISSWQWRRWTRMTRLKETKKRQATHEKWINIDPVN